MIQYRGLKGKDSGEMIKEIPHTSACTPNGEMTKETPHTSACTLRGASMLLRLYAQRYSTPEFVVSNFHITEVSKKKRQLKNLGLHAV